MNTLFFVALILLLEIRLRIINKRHNLELKLSSNKVLNSYNHQRIKESLTQGVNLVIIDNYVLDFQDFDLYHPGGKFVLRHNRGRDIAKFFYGSYKMIHEVSGSRHVHSARAFRIASSMIIGHLENQESLVP